MYANFQDVVYQEHIPKDALHLEINFKEVE